MVSISDLAMGDIFSGAIQLFFVILSFFIGFTMIKKYYSLGKDRIELASLGMQWIFYSSAWWGSAFSFLSILLFQYAFGEVEFVLTQNIFWPFATIFWVHAFTHVFFENKRRLFVGLTTIFVVLGDILMIVLFFTNRELVGTSAGYFQTDQGEYLTFLILVLMIVNVAIGFSFAVLSMRHDDKQIKRRGHVLFSSYMCIFISNMGILFFNEEMLLLNISRIILILGGILYYIAFFHKFS